MIVLHDVTKSFGGRVAVARASFALPVGGRTAVLGVNGAGKSTLLKLAGGLTVPDEGTVVRPPGVTVAYVPQDLGAAEFATLTGRAFLRDRVGVAQVEHALEILIPRVEAGDEAALQEYGDALQRLESLGGYDADARIERAVAQVGLRSEMLGRAVQTLSGGEQVRLGLAGILASKFDVYLLDEPTNHLDRDGVELLEEFLLESSASVAVVTHDRQMLNRLATHVLTVGESDHRVTLHHLTYAEYREAETAARAQQWRRHREYLAEVERLNSAARSHTATAARTRDARPPRDNDKFAGHFLTQRAAGQAAGAAKRMERRRDRLDPVDAPDTPWELRLSLAAATRSGDRVISVAGVTVSVGTFVLGPIDLEVAWGERLAVSGRNGAGKSLLLSVLAGDIDPDAGSVTVGAGVRIGLLRQGGLRAPTGESALETFRRITEWAESDARTLLAKFDLGAHHVLRPTLTYSPGERCRLALATLVAQGANCLILDEPTNHLDIEAREQLEQAVANFDGTVLVVSHDRQFLSDIAITREVLLREGRVVSDTRW